MTPRLCARDERLTERRAAGLQACYCAEEFTLRWIRPLGRWERLAYDYPQLTDSSREPTTCKMLNLYF
jgi:hypothetical protein